MNLNALTPDQRACVTHVCGPLLVSAGAGSGKTFMLTQRIVYALLHPEESEVEDIDQILAITFTELAASEIKARVRTRLREEGLTQASLKVDACWISTIHGMCSRILHESALDLGLDPQFGLLDETDRDQLLEDCVNEALAEAGAVPGPDGDVPTDGAFRTLFSEYEKADGPSNVGAMVTRIVNACANVRGGLDALVWADPPSPHDIARDVYRAMEDCDAVARTGIAANSAPAVIATRGKLNQLNGAFTDKARAALENPETGMPAFERLAARDDLDYGELAEALARIDLSFGSRTSKEPFATGYALFKAAIVDARGACALGLALPARTELLALARRVRALFDDAKASRGVLDQDDLLLKTLEALKTKPTIKARYRDRFKLVMVDEFQDTSGLQVALIGHLTDGDRRLCTVGDTQQSIYRFRGADVQTYREHKKAMRAHEPVDGLCRELDKNFRSHGDIIAFVNRVFGQDEVFGRGGEFIRLDWVKDHAASNPFPEVPRIDIVATTGPLRGVGTDERHLVEAEAIARRFLNLHADAPNQRWGDMVVLLGTMGRADVYARTLRAHGIPCIVSGGSGFSWTPEAQEVSALLNAVADPWDDTNLRIALCGAAFGLGAEELLRLSGSPIGERRHLWEGLLACRTADPSPRVRLAATLLVDAVESAGTRGAARTLTDLVVASGWLDRLQDQGPQGMARAANALKAIRLAESVENDPDTPRGIPATAARVARKLSEGMKEKPGALMAGGQDAVRILTVHASKGLEFPIVALADFYGLHHGGSRLRLLTTGNRIWLSLMPSASIADGTPLEDFTKIEFTDKQRERLIEAGHGERFGATEPVEANGALELDRAIVARDRLEELGELRRKFYVGATRPREALIIAVNMVDKKEGAPYGDVLEDLRRGLYGSFGDFATAPEGLDFGGHTRAAVERLRLSRDNEGGQLLVNGAPAADFLQPALAAELAGMHAAQGDAPAAAATPRPAGVPEAPRPGERLRDLVPGKRPCDPLRAGTFSYSYLNRQTAVPEGPCDPDELPAATPEDAGDIAANGGQGAFPGPAAPGSTAASDAAAARAAAPETRGVSPVAFGSALHQACQLMAEDLRVRREAGEPDAVLTAPSGQRLTACLRAWNLPAGELAKLEEAIGLWTTCACAAEAAGFPDVEPEAPFCVALQGPQGEPIHLEGTIDLFCCDRSAPAQDQTVLVVDYKTGGRASETPEALHAKHELQAVCYAYAVLRQGFGAVELAFVRVEQRDHQRPDQPQTVRYRYGRAELQLLEERIRDAYRAAGARV